MAVALERRTGRLALVVLALWLWHGRALAVLPVSSADDSCRTVSARLETEIVTAFADEQTPRLPVQAVTIEAGERLCIVGTPSATGELLNLRAVPSAQSGSWVSIQLEVAGGHTRLKVRHSDRRTLRYVAARVATALSLALPVSTVPVRPKTTSYEVWYEQLKRFVVFGFRFSEPQPQQAQARLPATLAFPGGKGQRPMIGFTFSLGAAQARFDELSRLLVRDGFTALPTNYHFFTIGVEGVFGPVRVGLPLEGAGLTSNHRQLDKQVSLFSFGGGLLLGYDFLRLPGSSTFLAARIGASGMTVDAKVEGWSLFAAELAPLGHVDSVDASRGHFSLELGHERYFSLGYLNASEQAAIQLGGRIGYDWQLGGTSWSTSDEDSHDLPGGPQLDFSGARFRLVLGLQVD